MWVEGRSPLGHTAITSIKVKVNPDPVKPVEWAMGSTVVEASADTTLDAWAVPWMPPMAGSAINLKVRGKDIRTALLSFDLTGLPAGTEILTATLKIFATTGKGSVLVGAYNVLRPWSEDNATWWEADAGTKWEEAGANGAADRDATPTDSQVVDKTGWVMFDVTAAAQTWVDGTGYGIALRGDEVLSPFGGECHFISREFTEYRPMLEVQYRYPKQP